MSADSHALRALLPTRGSQAHKLLESFKVKRLAGPRPSRSNTSEACGSRASLSAPYPWTRHRGGGAPLLFHVRDRPSFNQAAAIPANAAPILLSTNLQTTCRHLSLNKLTFSPLFLPFLFSLPRYSSFFLFFFPRFLLPSPLVILATFVWRRWGRRINGSRPVFQPFRTTFSTRCLRLCD